MFFEKLENDGLITFKRKGLGGGASMYQLRLSDKGQELYGYTYGNVKRSDFVSILTEKVKSIIGISTSPDGMTAKVRFSVQYNNTPFYRFSTDRGRESAERDKVKERTVQFTKYDSGWMLEQAED